MSRKPEGIDGHPHAFIGGRYRGVCQYVVDGDTMDVLIDMGFYQYAYERIRLQDVDTPEIYGAVSDEERARGYEARDFVQATILGEPVVIETERDETSFGRFTARLWFQDVEGEWHDLGEVLVEQGLAKRVEP